MPPDVTTATTDEPDFKWGIKRGKGGKKKDVQFYESFTYDGVDYSLYDCVYLHVDDQPAPYIAKLLKIWENADKSRRIKVQWFFYPFEISTYLEGVETLENELFFASGVGDGLVHINPLETIGGKCNVVCISKDSRNPQPPAETLQIADFVFYRTFDVGLCKISDQLDDKVGGLEVKFVFNRKEDFDRLASDSKAGEINGVVLKETPNLQGLRNVMQTESPGVKHVQVNQETNTENKLMEKESALLEKHSGVKDKIQDIMLLENQVRVEDKVSSAKSSSSNKLMEKESALSGVKDKIQDIMLLENQVRVEDKVSSAKSSSSNKLMEKEAALSEKHSGVKDKIQDIKLLKNHDQVEDKVNSANKSGTLDDVLSKRAHIDGEVTLSKVRSANSADNDCATHLATSILSEKKHKTDVKSSCGLEKDSKLAQKPNKLDENLSKRSISLINGTPNEKAKLSTSNTSRNDKQKEGRGPGQAPNIETSSSGLTKSRLKKSTVLFNEKRKLANDVGHEIKETTLFDDLCHMEEGPSKKAKFEDSTRKPNVGDNIDSTTIKDLKKKCSASEEGSTKKAKFVDATRKSNVDDNDASAILKMSKEKNRASQSKSLPTLSTSHVDKAKLGIDNGPSKEHHNDKKVKGSNDDSPKASTTTSKSKDNKVEGQKFEVFPRPLTGKGNWIKLPWEERMKSAHDQGRLVLLMNLAPYYTSGEVEDIIWHAFKENCTAKVLQHTATSNRNSGQAFVAFRTREVADRVLKKLDDGCLMLPNRRPLVACVGVLPKSSKQKTFFGHLGIDKTRMQIQRELKDAVSTSHYSQTNTIEYDMAMSWCLQQSRSDKCWEKLYEKQNEALKKLAAGFKSK